MKVHYLTFSTPMVPAILEGRKTQTRRLIPEKTLWKWTGHDHHLIDMVNASPIKPGDMIGVRETWARARSCFVYKASSVPEEGPRGNTDEWNWDHNVPNVWRPSSNMPNAACRLFLRVETVRAERVQDIGEEGAIAEGVETEPRTPADGSRQPWRRYDGAACAAVSARHSFETLWDSIHGAGAWARNDWVWAYTFSRTEKP